MYLNKFHSDFIKSHFLFLDNSKNYKVTNIRYIEHALCRILSGIMIWWWWQIWSQFCCNIVEKVVEKISFIKRCSVTLAFIMNNVRNFLFPCWQQLVSVFQIPAGFLQFSSTQTLKYLCLDALIEAVTSFLARSYLFLARSYLSRINTWWAFSFLWIRSMMLLFIYG